MNWRCFFGLHLSTQGALSVAHGWSKLEGPRTFATFRCDRCYRSFVREDPGYLPLSFYRPGQYLDASYDLARSILETPTPEQIEAELRRPSSFGVDPEGPLN